MGLTVLRGITVAASLLAVMTLPACSKNCVTSAMSIAAGAQGETTADAALTAFLDGDPDGFTTEPSAWHPTTTSATEVDYSDGTGRLVLTQVGSQGWFVTTASTCMS
jgi:hypothetical protein